MAKEKDVAKKKKSPRNIAAKAVKSKASRRSSKSSTKSTVTQQKRSSFKITLSSKKILALGFIPLIVVILILLGYLYKGEFIVATVNGKPITRVKLWKALEQQGGAQSLDALITQELIEQESKKQNVVVSQQDIALELQNIEESILSQGSTLEQALATQGMSKEQLEEQIRLQKMLEKLVEGNSAVTENDINEALASLLESGQEDTPQLREQIRGQLEQTKSAQAVQEYVTRIRQDANISILNDNFNSVLQQNSL